MIYQLHCGLIMVGYAACSTLLGSYMFKYAGAREADLGWIFMVQPLTIFFRPLICAHSDRRQAHKQMLAFFALLAALAYLPFIVYPFLERRLLEAPHTPPERQLDKRPLFWTLMAFHLVGSVGWCGVRSLGDALAVNYAKRIGSDYARYRKYGAISYGLCNFSLGFINQDWWLPDYVAALGAYSASMSLVSLLVFAWPDEYFVMSSENNDDERLRRAYIESLPGAGATLRHMARKLFLCSGQSGGQRPQINRSQGHPAVSAHDKLGRTVSRMGEILAQADHKQTVDPQAAAAAPATQQKLLTTRQQLRIFGLLVKRDFRILLYLLIIMYGGLTGYSGSNFVFTYMNQVCRERGTCKGARLAGMVMLSYCFVETTVYLLVDRYRKSLNRTLMLELTFLALALHYFFYGFLLDHLSPYFFLVESLHGIEYGISLTSSVELGYYFAREVELLLPELLQRGIISPHDDQQLVRVSLLATMSGCYTLAYDGVGCILGCLIYGQVLGHFGFTITWRVIGASAAAGLLVIGAGYALGKCLRIRPEILRIRDRQLAAAAAAATVAAPLGGRE